MLTSITALPINHILQKESWARKRLQVYAGKTARIRIFPITSFNFSIQDSGEISALPEDASVDAVITLTPGLFLRILSNDETVFNDITLSGDSAFAKALINIGKHLRWDIEQDLSGITGDILSHRIVEVGENLIQWQTESLQSLSQALAEYWMEEQPMLTNNALINEFNQAVEKLQFDIEQLEHRIQALKNRAN